MRSRALTALSASVLLALVAAGGARGTTGASIGFPAPRFVVPLSVSESFAGRYVMTAVGGGANIRSGEAKIEISGVDKEGTAEGPYFPVGGLQISQYNASGQPETALFSLYPFHLVPGGIAATVLTQGLRFNPVGRIKLRSPESERELRGELVLHNRGPFPVTFKRLFEDEVVNESTPPAKQLAEVSQRSAARGWGPTAVDYEGEYEVTNSTPDATAEAALLAPVIRATQGVGLAGAPVSSGEMTVTGGNVPSAEITVESNGESVTYYLSDLAWRGDARIAKVRSGSPSGRIVGDFEGHQSGAVLKGTLDGGTARYDLVFAKAD